MAKKHVHTSNDAEPPKSDDLKVINGIGPAVENRLRGVGIYTFAQLAALSPADIAASVSDLTGLTAERIIKQDWIGQARKLASQTKETELQKDTEASPISLSQAKFEVEAQKDHNTPTGLRHNATFTVELVLNEDNEVLSTELVHIQSRNKEHWAGWQVTPLIDFLVQHARATLPPIEFIPAATKESDASIDGEGHASAPAVVEEEFTSTGREDAEPAYPIVEEAEAIAEEVPGRTLHLREMETIPLRGDSPRSLLPHDQPFEVRLALDFADVGVPGNVALNYTVSIHAKKLGDRARQLIGEAHGVIVPSEKSTIKVEGSALAQGIYRLEAAVALNMANEKDTSHPDLMALMKGGVFQVY